MRLVWTASINDRVADDKEFAKFVVVCLDRYRASDWGEMDDEDTETNNDAASYGGRILASYNLPKGMKHNDGIGDHRIWIITEADRSVTTILWPSEY